VNLYIYLLQEQIINMDSFYEQKEGY